MKFPKIALLVFTVFCLSTVLIAEKKRYIVKLEHPEGKKHGLGTGQAGYNKARHALQKELQKQGIKMKEIKALGLLNFVTVEIEEEDLDALEKTEGVVRVVQEDKKDNFPDAIEGAVQVESTEAWNLGFRGQEIKVGIIDTGLDYNHPDIAPNYAGGYDFAYDDNDPMDLYASGHGTHVGGTVVAVAPKVSLYGIKVFQDSGGAYSSDVIAGILWAMDPDGDGDFSDHLDVVNMSLSGGGSPDDAKCLAVQAAYEVGVISVVSAGNAGNRLFATAVTPASCWEAITVGANTKAVVPEMASFSSFGPVIYQDKDYWKPDITGPGVSICAAKAEASTRSLCWEDPPRSSLSGTSMSSPIVTGAVVLAIQSHPSYTPSQIKRLLKSTADPLVGYTYDGQGTGEVNALKVVQGNDSGPLTASMTPSGAWLGGASGGDVSFSREILVEGIADGSTLNVSGYPMSVTPVSGGKFIATVHVPERQEEGIYVSRASFGDQTRFTGVFSKDDIPPVANLVFSSPQQVPFTVSLEATDNVCVTSIKLSIPYTTGNIQSFLYVANRMYYCNVEGREDDCFPKACRTTKSYTLSNRSAPDGIYEVTGEVTDASGNSVLVTGTLVIGTEPPPPDPDPDPDPPPIDPPEPPDTEPPQVAITSPITGTVVQRKEFFLVEATVVDNVGIESVVFRMDGYLKCTARDFPYECNMYAPAKPNATLRISVEAFDEARNSSTANVSVMTSKGGKPK